MSNLDVADRAPAKRERKVPQTKSGKTNREREKKKRDRQDKKDGGGDGKKDGGDEKK